MRVDTFRFSMNKCSHCVGHAHCEACGEDLMELLSRVPEIERASVCMKKREITVHTTLDNDNLEDELEQRGVFRL